MRMPELLYAICSDVAAKDISFSSSWHLVMSSSASVCVFWVCFSCQTHIGFELLMHAGKTKASSFASLLTVAVTRFQTSDLWKGLVRPGTS